MAPRTSPNSYDRARKAQPQEPAEQVCPDDFPEWVSCTCNLQAYSSLQKQRLKADCKDPVWKKVHPVLSSASVRRDLDWDLVPSGCMRRLELGAVAWPAPSWSDRRVGMWTQCRSPGLSAGCLEWQTQSCEEGGSA